MSRGTSNNALKGFYSPGQAMLAFGITNRDLFHALMDKYKQEGRLTIIMPARTRMYKQEDVHFLADELRLELLMTDPKENRPARLFRAATAADAQAIGNVLRSYGWRAVDWRQRQEWYTANPLIDHVVVQPIACGQSADTPVVVSYWNMMPLADDVLEEMLAGRRRGWHLHAEDIRPYTPGQWHDVFVGLATHKLAPSRAEVGRQLLLGVFGEGGILHQWARQGIFIRRMHATTDQPDGIATATLLGFERQRTVKGDQVADWRYVLDLSTSHSHFAVRYRAVMRETAERMQRQELVQREERKRLERE